MEFSVLFHLFDKHLVLFVRTPKCKTVYIHASCKVHCSFIYCINNANVLCRLHKCLANYMLTVANKLFRIISFVCYASRLLSLSANMQIYIPISHLFSYELYNGSMLSRAIRRDAQNLYSFWVLGGVGEGRNSLIFTYLFLSFAFNCFL